MAGFLSENSNLKADSSDTAATQAMETDTGETAKSFKGKESSKVGHARGNYANQFVLIYIVYATVQIYIIYTENKTINKK